MANRMRFLLAALLSAALLSGCTDNTVDEVPSPADEATLVGEDGRDLRLELRADDQVPLPVWEVGDWFGHHIFFGPNDEEGIHINVIVTEDQGSAWFLATDDPEIAKFEAIYDVPLTGPIAKDGLATTGFGGPWKYYDFPIRDGKTWTGVINMGFGYPQADLTFTATFNERIQTPYGPRPGYDIIGTDAEGAIQVVTDYVPDIEWYTKFEYYTADDPENYEFKTISMGFGSNWTGTYYVDTATEMASHQDIVAVNPESPDASGAQPSPYSSFTMTEGSTYLSGFFFDFAFAGAHDMELIDPNNKRHQFTVTDTGSGSGGFDFVDLDAVPGQWHIASGGAGVAHGSGMFLWEVTETSGTL